MTLDRTGPDATGLLPFVSHRSLDAPVGWRDGRLLTVRRLIGEAHALAARLPEQGAMLNACGDRFDFTVGLLAALLRNQQSILPNNLVAHTVAELRDRFASLYQLTDRTERRVDGLPEVRIDTGQAGTEAGRRGTDTAAAGETLATGAADDGMAIPAFPSDRIAACLFTSGSTGRPVAHPRTWGAIVQSARAEAAALDMDGGTRWTVLGTVPPQHSYGFESTVHLALQARSLLAAEHPFYPADVLELLARLPAPRLLVTTPVHLRALLAEVAASESAAPGRPAVRIERLMAATAPLPQELARRAEQAFGAELVEIYGSTESGQVALRRPTRDETWQTLPGVRIELRAGRPHARDGHVGEPTPLGDVLDLLDDQHFLLRGRTADMVNIAGKRSSIAFLDRQLLSIDGVVDGAFHLPDADDRTDGRATRLTAFVVAPTLTAAALTEALRDRIEPVFLPRPLHFVDALPRDGNGKLPRQRLQALARALSADR